MILVLWKRFYLKVDVNINLQDHTKNNCVCAFLKRAPQFFYCPVVNIDYNKVMKLRIIDNFMVNKGCSLFF